MFCVCRFAEDVVCYTFFLVLRSTHPCPGMNVGAGKLAPACSAECATRWWERTGAGWLLPVWGIRLCWDPLAWVGRQAFGGVWAG